MKRRTDPIKTFLPILAVLLLGACGGPGQDIASGLRNNYNDEISARVVAEEKGVKSSPYCSGLSEQYSDSLLTVINLYNNRVATAWGLPMLAGHPDMEGAISVRICKDQQISAYALGNTVVVHEGLLYKIESAVYNSADTQESDRLFLSSLGFIIYHEIAHIELGHSTKRSDPYMEWQADTFSESAIKESGLDPAGAQIVFSIAEEIVPGGSIGHVAPSIRAMTAQMQMAAF